IAIAVGIAFGQAHVSLLVDRVVKSLIADKCDGNGRLAEVGMAEDGVQAHRPATAPTPDAHPARIDEPPALLQGSNRLGLVLRREDSDLAIDALAPGTPSRARCPSVVDARDHEAMLGEHPMPEVIPTAPLIQHRLTGGLAVDVDQERVTLRGVESRRLEAPTIKFGPVLDRDPEEF